MLKIVIGDSHTNPLLKLIEELPRTDSLELVDVCTTGRHAADLLRTNDVDAFIFPDDWAETCRAIRLSNDDHARRLPSFVVASAEATKTLLVKALLYGFDGLVQTSDDTDRIARKIVGIVDGTERITEETPLQQFNIKHGLLSRELIIDDPGDRDLAQLVGAGFPDGEIAAILDWTIQRVRNRIEHLLTANGLAYRTQLAVLSSSVWRIPDFR